MFGRIVGWTAVVICTLISGFWGFWGAVEGFHEGWWHGSLAGNLFHYSLYLLPGLAVAATGVLSLHRPRIGMAMFGLMGVFVALWVLSGNFRVTSGNWPIVATFTALPVALGLMLLLGDPRPRRVSAWIMGGIPVLVIAVSGCQMAVGVLQRVDDGNRGTRIVHGNGVVLEWVGAGPGWERQGSVSWWEASRRCAYLSGDGRIICETPQNIWRLPTADELVRSLSLHGRNCGGIWDAATGSARYRLRPDKESPLWDTNSQVTYYWTSTEKDKAHAYWVVYHGGVFALPKTHAPGNAGFRAVRAVRTDDRSGQRK